MTHDTTLYMGVFPSVLALRHACEYPARSIDRHVSHAARPGRRPATASARHEAAEIPIRMAVISGPDRCRARGIPGGRDGDPERRRQAGTGDSDRGTAENRSEKAKKLARIRCDRIRPARL